MTPPNEYPHLTPTTREKREINALLSHFQKQGGDISQIYQIIEGQLSVLHGRAQSLTQLAGVVITVTGFSGRIIADTNPTAQVLIILGLFLVLIAAAICMAFVMPIRWVSSYLHLPREQWILTALRRRQKKNKAFKTASMIMILGLFFYICSISIMLIYPEQTELQMVR